MVLGQMRKTAYSKLIDNIGIKKKMVIVLLVFSAVPFMLINMLSFAAGRHLILKLMAETSSEQLQKTNEEIHQEIVDMSLVLLEKLRYHGEFLRDLVEESGEAPGEIVEEGKVVKRLARFSEEYSFDSIYIYTENKVFSVQNTDDFDAEYDARKSWWLLDALEEEEPVVLSDIHYDLQGRIKSKKVVSYVVKITKDTGEGTFEATMVCNKLLSEWIRKYYSKSYDETVLVTDRKGDRLFTMNSRLRIDNAGEIFPAHVLEKASGYCLNNFYGEKYLTVWGTSELAGVKVIKTIPHRSLVGSLNLISFLTIAAFAVFLVLTILMLHLLSESIVKPIENLKLSMEGHEVERDKLISRHDELGELSGSYYTMQDNQRRMIREIEETNRKKVWLELNLLNAQINPHFLYNTINTIRSLAMIQGNRMVAESLKNLSELLRSSIQIGRNFITSEEELKQIENYVKIQKLRYLDMFDVCYEVEEGVRERYTLSFLLQPIVENAIFYGMENETGGGRIRICIRQEEEHIIYQVSDNGPGMSGDIMEELKASFDAELFPSGKAHIGLKNIHDRLKLFFGAEQSLEIFSEQGSGTRIVVRIPVIYDIKEMEEG